MLPQRIWFIIAFKANNMRTIWLELCAHTFIVILWMDLIMNDSENNDKNERDVRCLKKRISMNVMFALRMVFCLCSAWVYDVMKDSLAQTLSCFLLHLRRKLRIFGNSVIKLLKIIFRWFRHNMTQGRN